MAVTPPLQEPRGTMPVLQFCTPAQLQVDASYQRPTDAQQSRKLINRIARAWDWRLYQPLVVARRADGNLYVVDGQHRLEAARERGDIPQLPCVVTSYDSAVEEAGAFVELNQARKPLTQLNLYKASLAAGDEGAAVIQGVLDRAGLRLTAVADRNSWKPGWIDNISVIRQCHRRHGERVLRLSLEALRDGFDGQVLRHCGTLFAAIHPTVAEAGTNYVPFLMTEILRDADMAGWMGRFRAAATDRQVSVSAAARALIAEAYAEAAGDDDEAEAA